MFLENRFFIWRGRGVDFWDVVLPIIAAKAKPTQAPAAPEGEPSAAS
jgi:hypothetical protein